MEINASSLTNFQLSHPTRVTNIDSFLVSPVVNNLTTTSLLYFHDRQFGTTGANPMRLVDTDHVPLGLGSCGAVILSTPKRKKDVGSAAPCRLAM